MNSTLYPNQVTVNDPKEDKLYEFPCYRWFPDENDGSLFCEIALPGELMNCGIALQCEPLAYKIPFCEGCFQAGLVKRYSVTMHYYFVKVMLSYFIILVGELIALQL